MFLRAHAAVLMFFSALAIYSQIPDTEGQDSAVDLNAYYRYPFSFGVAGYYQQAVWPEQNGGGENAGIASVFRWTKMSAPYLQPILRFAIAMSGERVPTFNSIFHATQINIAGGLGVSHRFSKVLEAGADVYGGYSHFVFRNLPDSYPNNDGESDFILASAPGALFGVGINLVVKPLFNLSINLSPRLEYYLSLAGLSEVNGLNWSIEAAVRCRLGRDPDRETGSIRSIRFGVPTVQPLFAAMQSFYVTNPVGSVSITNIDSNATQNVEVSFFQPGFMDSPTSAASIDILEPEEVATIQLPASFNETVFEIEGVTPLSGEIIVTYRSDGKAAEQRRSVTFDLYDKTSITWADDRKMGAFITPADRIVRSFASQIRQTHKDVVIPGLSDEVQFAIQVYNTIAARGLLYQPDPASPFTSAQGDNGVVDSVSLPRDTLELITGDFDDITALYSALLESVGIETAFLTTPNTYMQHSTQKRRNESSPRFIQTGT